MRKLVLCSLLACLLLFVLSGTALAKSKTPTLKSLAKSLTALQKQVNSLKSLSTKQATTVTSLTSDLSAAKQTITSLTSDLSSAKQTIAGLQATLTSAAPVLALAPYVSVTTTALNGVGGPNIVFQGCNLLVRSTTNEYDTSGLGNLIVGWDSAPSTLPSPYRSGSNNLVVGDQNNFTSNGCLVAGDANTVSGIDASVTGGVFNQATTNDASVSGGQRNTASAWYSSVSGGENNVADGWYASVSGGGAPVGITVSTTAGWAAGGDGPTGYYHQ
jgi:uncharacterized protein YoxC